jgi:hypothetical protein
MALLGFTWPLQATGSRDITVGISTDYGLNTKESEFESRYGEMFSFLHVVQTCSGAHPTSCNVYWWLFVRVKGVGR